LLKNLVYNNIVEIRGGKNMNENFEKNDNKRDINLEITEQDVNYVQDVKESQNEQDDLQESQTPQAQYDEQESQNEIDIQKLKEEQYTDCLSDINLLNNSNINSKSESIEIESKDLIERRKIVKIVATAVGAVLAVQILFGVLFIAGFSLINPGFFDRMSSAFLGEEVKNSKSMIVQQGDGTVRNIVIEKTDTPVVAIAEKVGPAVVGIKVTARTANAWPFGGGESTPEGSGIIMKKDGYIMTNNHVIEEALAQRSNKISNGSKIEVILPSQKDKPYIATVIGRDERTDLAVLKIDADNLPEIEIGNSDDIKVGETVIAIGNPGGLEYMGSVTAGIVSGLNRTIPVEDGKELKLIQTDAAINPGNSGGALVNAQGKLIGINAAKIGGQGFEGLGFAIPVNKVMQVTGSLIEFKYVKGRPLFGIVADPRYTEEMANEYDMPVGVLVSDVTPFTGAFDAGIKPKDIITKFGGTPVKNINELNEIKAKFKPGDIVDVEMYRSRVLQTLKVQLSEDKR
jgi:serine protease Do